MRSKSKAWEGLPEFEHHVVRRIHHIVDGILAQRSEPRRNQSGEGCTFTPRNTRAV